MDGRLRLWQIMRKTALSKLWLAILKFNGGRLDDKTTKSLVKMRLAVEGQALRMFAKSHTKDDIATLWSMIDDIREYGSKQDRIDRNEMAQMLFHFHRFICLRSGNTFFPKC